jgi:hypothetical protein
VAAAHPTVVGRVVAAWPPLALPLAWELLLQVRAPTAAGRVHDDWRVSAPVLVDAARKWSGHLATAAVGALGGQGEVEESGGDLFATPREGGKEVARWDELPGDVFVVWLPGVEFDPCPPAVWEWPLGPSVAWGVPDVLAGQVAAGGHPGPGFLGGLAHKGVAGGLTRFRAGRQEGC